MLHPCVAKHVFGVLLSVRQLVGIGMQSLRQAMQVMLGYVIHFDVMLVSIQRVHALTTGISVNERQTKFGKVHESPPGRSAGE